MEENWCALCISILKKVTPEQAFDYMGPRAKKSKLTEKDILDMIELKKKYTYEEVGEMYGLSKDAIHKRIKRYLDSKGIKRNVKSAS